MIHAAHLRRAGWPRRAARVLFIGLLLLNALTSPGVAEIGGESAEEASAVARLELMLDEGLYLEAEEEARRLIADLSLHGDPTDALEADLLHVLAGALIGLGRYQEPEVGEVARRALSIRTEMCGPRCAEVARSEILLSRLDAARADYASAEQHARAALAIVEELPETSREIEAEGLERLAVALWRMARHDEARALFERAIAMHEGSPASQSFGMCRSLDGLGRILAERGDLQGALALFERSFAIREGRLGKDHHLLAQSLSAIATVHRSLGSFDEAIALLERALAITESRLGPDHPGTAMALNNLANTRWAKGDLEAARRLHERAMQIRLEKLGPSHPETAWSYQNYAGVLYDLGDYSLASGYYRKANDVWTAKLGPDHPNVGANLIGLGSVYRGMRDLQAARGAFERALEIHRKVHGERNARTVEAHEGLAYVYLDLDRPAEAVTAFRQALEIQKSLKGMEDAGVAHVMESLGYALLKQGELEEARSLISEAAGLQQNSLGPEAHELGFSLMDLGAVHMELGQLEEAERLARRAASIFEAGGRIHRARLQCSLLLARILLLAGRPGESLDAALESERIGREAFRGFAPILTEGGALRYERQRASGLDIGLSVVTREMAPYRGAQVQKAFDAVIRSRALVLAEMAERSRFLSLQQMPETAGLVQDLRSASLRLSKLAFGATSVNATQPSVAIIDAARKEKERAELALASHSNAHKRGPQPDGAGLSEIARALPDGAALVAFVRFNRTTEGRAPPPIPGKPPKTREAPFYLAFVLPPSPGDVVLLPLGPASAIDGAVSSWRRAASTPPHEVSGPDARSMQEYSIAGTALRQAIWDPLEVHLGAARMVLVVPDGPLSLVSFGTLPRPDGRFLADTGPFFHYLSAERDLLPVESSGPRTGGLLAIGSPSYDVSLAEAGRPVAESVSLAALDARPASSAQRVYEGPRSDCDDPRSMRFSPLPATQAEVQGITKLWTDPGKERLPSGAGARSLTGTQASESAFKLLAPGREVLHIATHGFFLESDCRPSEAGSGGEADARSSVGRASGGTGEGNPMLLSGLALAGANHRGEIDLASDQEDGILTAEEISVLDLESVDWAVLSACETGLGEVQAGEGVLGLRRAFETAGVRTLIMSLWAVDDVATLTWMKHLYGHRRAGLSTWESVRRSTAESLEDRRDKGLSTHPFFWGGFIAAGDWR